MILQFVVLCARSDVTPPLGKCPGWDAAGREVLQLFTEQNDSSPIWTELLPGSAAGRRGRWTPGQSWWLPEVQVQPAGYEQTEGEQLV